jgi:hypothetical protein
VIYLLECSVQVATEITLRFECKLKVTWFCNNLVASGTDQYGDSYTY